jgi:hypothetical protein
VSTSLHGVPARPAKLACAGTTTVQGIASSAPQTNYGGDIALSWEPTFQSCLTTCSTTAGCVDVSPRPAAVEMGRVRSDIRIWGPRTGFVSSCSHCCLVHAFNSDAYPTYCGSLINSISTLRRLHSCLWSFLYAIWWDGRSWEGYITVQETCGENYNPSGRLLIHPLFGPRTPPFCYTYAPPLFLCSPACD